MDILSSLNSEQRKAVEEGDGPVVIVAGPGTGKTKTLTARIAYLLQQGRVKPEQIIALTFTVKAAREMRQRVIELIGDNKMPDILTFHALGHQLLQEQNSVQEATFVSESERQSIIRNLAKAYSVKGMTARELGLVISRQKGALMPAQGEIAGLVRAYDAELRARNRLDFDDLLFRTHQLLQDPAQSEHLRARYRYILIDEFQDTSELQWAIIDLLRGNENVFVIGDPKQSIYSFRGAGAEMFDRFRGTFPKHRAITLQTNYRSAGSIVGLANQIFPESEALEAYSAEAGTVQAIQTLNEYSEADLVLRIIEQGIGGSNLLSAGESEGKQFRDFAVLYRTHQAARKVQQRLHDSGIPVQVVGEGSPYEQPEIQAIIGCLKWLLRRDTLPAVQGFRDVQIQILLDDINSAEPASILARAIAQRLGLESDDSSRRLRLQQFVGTLVRFDVLEHSLEACVEYVEQIEQGDFYDPVADVVTLMTVHASKGLEFPHVILIGAEEGILPHIRKGAEPNIPEEQRLFYVAATRAGRQLDIIYAKKRGNEGRQVSRFIANVADQFLPRTTDPNLANLEKKLRRRQQKARQSTLF